MRVTARGARAPLLRVISPRARRRRRAVVLVTLLTVTTAAAGALAASHVAVSALAEANVLVRPLPGNAYSSRTRDTFVDLKTEAQLPASDAVLTLVSPPDATAAELQDLRRRVNARLVDDTDVLVVSARAGSQDAAVALVSDVAAATLAVRRARAELAFDERGAVLDGHIDEAEAGLRRARAAGGSAEQVSVLSRRLVVLRAEQRAIASARPDAGAVITTSSAPTPRRRLQYAIVAGSGLAGGSAGLLAIAVQARRQRLRRQRSVARRRLPVVRAAALP